MDAFVAAVNYTIDTLEGGGRLTRDTGGATRFGISKRGNPDVDVENLTRDDAVRLYHERYWLPARCDQLPAALALQFFVAYVNMPPKVAVRLLQAALGVEQDGRIGPLTIGAAREFLPRSELRARFSRACLEYYIALAENRPVYRPYRHGWIGRVCRVADEAGRWGGPE